jgi:hypothetical protein
LLSAADHPESEKKAPEQSSDKKTLRTDDSSKDEDSKDDSEDKEETDTAAAASDSDAAESSDEESEAEEEEEEEGAEKPVSKEATDKLAKAVKTNADYQFSDAELSGEKPAQKCEEYSEYDYYVSPASPEPDTKCAVCIKMRNGPCPHTFRLWER